MDETAKLDAFKKEYPFEIYIEKLRKKRLWKIRKYRQQTGKNKKGDWILALIDNRNEENTAKLYEMYEDYCRYKCFGPVESQEINGKSNANEKLSVTKFADRLRKRFAASAKGIYEGLERKAREYGKILTEKDFLNIRMDEISLLLEKYDFHEALGYELSSVKYQNENISALIYKGYIGIDNFCEYTIAYLVKKYSDSMMDTYKEDPEYATVIAEILAKPGYRADRRIEKEFLESLRQNKLCKAIYKEYQEYELRNIMLLKDRIPEHMTDMYPLTRNMKRHFVLHVGPTNSGKTYQSIERLKACKKGVYLAPLRLLTYEIYDKLNESGVPCNMLTGEEAIEVPNAMHTSCTIEMLDEIEEYDLAVIDEGQNVGDSARGGAWTKAILGVRAKEVHICSDESCVNLVIRMIEQCNDTYELITHERMTTLSLDKSFKRFPEDVKDRDALIVFSRKSVMAVAADLQKRGIAASILYGNLPYDVRLNEVKRFVEGETKVVVATDAIGMGVNLPIKRVVLLETKKFDGKSIRRLYPTEIRQIAGRAGRRGMYSNGLYTAEFGKNFVDEAMKQKLPELTRARVDFPESLVELDMSLSELLNKWYDIPDEDIYVKSILEDDLVLCRELEKTISDKQLIYKCITIAFDSRNKRLHSIFIDLANAEAKNYDECQEEIRNIVELNAVVFDEDIDKLTLDELGEQYAVYDLLYAFLRKFNHKEYLQGIMDLKRDCSSKMMHILKTQELVGKLCPECGAALKWNYPYKLCQDCFEKKYYPQ